MKKFTKIMIGAGLTVAALGAAAAPATAAPVQTDASVAAQGDRVEGPFNTMSGLGYPNWNAFGAPDQNGVAVPLVAASAGAGTPAGGAQYTFPAFGTTGPISPAGAPDRCLTGAAYLNYAAVTLEACDGSAMQTFEITPAGTIFFAGTSLGLSDNGAPPTGSLVVWNDGRSYESLIANQLSPVVAPVVTPVDVTGATTDTKPVFSGTGDPGATVEITLDDGTSIGSTTVAADGSWSIPSTVDIPNGDTHFTATQTATDNSVTTDDITVTILGTPVVDPIMAGGAAIALLAAAGVVAAKRRKGTEATA